MLSTNVILNASKGEAEAVEQVRRYYSRYMDSLARRLGYLDVEAVCCMEARLVSAILRFDPTR